SSPWAPRSSSPPPAPAPTTPAATSDGGLADRRGGARSARAGRVGERPRAQPAPPVAPDEVLGGRGPPGAGGVAREVRARRCPGREDRRHNGPGGLHLVRPHEEGLVP